MFLDEAVLFVVSLAHVLCAVMWIGGNLFELTSLLPALKHNSAIVQDEVATTVPMREHEVSRITATLTIIFGPILAYLSSKGNMSVFFNTDWGITIVIGGIIALVLYGVGTYAGKIRVEIATITKSILKPNSFDEGRTHEKESLVPLRSKLLKLVYVENALGVIVLGLMVLAGSLAM